VNRLLLTQLQALFDGSILALSLNRIERTHPLNRLLGYLRRGFFGFNELPSRVRPASGARARQ
jgi:hypothetical protein